MIPYKLKTWFKEFALCLASALLLALSFPKTDIWICAWGGLVPLMLVLDGKRAFKAFRLAYLTGFLFFGATVWWIGHVDITGAVLLVMYLALYIGLWGLGYSLLRRLKPFMLLFVLSALWVLLEYARAHVLTGFGWVSLGYSQYKNLLMIQMADLTGFYGVSFLIVMVNYAVKEIYLKKKWKDVKAVVLIASAFVAAAALYGAVRLSHYTKTAGSNADMTIAVVQGNIENELRWYEPAWPIIMDKYVSLTEKAAGSKPQLIIWPESVYPGILWEDPDELIQIRALVKKMGIPILFGAVTKQGLNYYNSALLMGPDGKFESVYNKLHLVPYGEYIPYRKEFPFLADIVPIDDFTPGNTYTLFPFSVTDPRIGAPYRFAVLVCFEDAVERLSRRFVLKGADVLVNITNDAWFADTKEPFMHLQSSVLRAVENRRSMVRAANTGVSCFISPAGKIIGYLQDRAGKKTYVAGYAVGRVPVAREITFYTRFGDWLVFMSLLLVVYAMFRAADEGREKR